MEPPLLLPDYPSSPPACRPHPPLPPALDSTCVPSLHFMLTSRFGDLSRRVGDLCVCRHYGDLYVYIIILATYALFMFDILTTKSRHHPSPYSRSWPPKLALKSSMFNAVCCHYPLSALRWQDYPAHQNWLRMMIRSTTGDFGNTVHNSAQRCTYHQLKNCTKHIFVSCVLYGELTPP